jgi:hypothetical protein
MLKIFTFTITAKLKGVLLLFLLVFLSSGCPPPRYSNKAYNKDNFPIEHMSELFDIDASSFLEVRESIKYITLKNYDFYVMDYKYNGKNISFSMAVSKDKNIFFLLNYPERFSFYNFNNMIKYEKYSIPSEAHAVLYLKFLTKLFIPDSTNLDEVRSAMEKGEFPKDTKVFKLLNTYKTDIKYSGGGGILTSADFYSISDDFLLYRWQVQMKKNGEVAACKVTMMSLDSDYEVHEQAVMFDEEIDPNPGEVKDDPSFDSP